jgi:hypothetical protein
MVFPYTPLSAAHNATVRALASAHRTAQFALIHTGLVEISIEKSLPKPDEAALAAAAGEDVRVAATKILPDNTAQGLAYRGPFSEADLGAWLAELTSGETDLNMLSKKPSAARRRLPASEEEAATRAERRKARKAERRAAEDAVKAANEEAMKTLTPEERAEREAELKQRQQEWERKRREQMEVEAGSIFEEDDEDEESEAGDEVEEEGEEDEEEEEVVEELA